MKIYIILDTRTADLTCLEDSLGATAKEETKK